MHRILIVADFTGRTPHKVPSPFSLHRVDRDNLDTLPGTLGVEIKTASGIFVIRSFDEFHPDLLLRHRTDTPAPAPERIAPSAAPPPARQGGSLLESIVATQDPVPVRTDASDAEDLAGFIRRVTTGHTAKAVAPKDRAAETEWLNSVLHDPHFQSVEAAWRSLELLVSGLDEAGTALYLLDATLPEFISQMDSLRDQLKRKGEWALIVGGFYFSQSPVQLAALERIGELASSVNATFLSAAASPFEPSDEWNALRHSSVAENICLLLPRILLRLPYGRKGLSIDAFRFEENPSAVHDLYLWGNPAFLAAKLIADSLDSGKLARRVDGLPMALYEEDGDSVAKPCAEVLLTERDAEALLDTGLMPVASLKNQDGVVIVRYQSIADPSGVPAVLA